MMRLELWIKGSMFCGNSTLTSQQKHTKTRLQHGRIWIILATENPFRELQHVHQRLFTAVFCQVPLSPTKATLETDTTATGGHLKGKKWHFVTKKWPIESRVTQETHSEIQNARIVSFLVVR